MLWFGMNVTVTAIVSGFVLNNKILTKKMVIVTLIVAKFIIEIILFNDSYMDKV